LERFTGEKFPKNPIRAKLFLGGARFSKRPLGNPNFGRAGFLNAGGKTLLLGTPWGTRGGGPPIWGKNLFAPGEQGGLKTLTRGGTSLSRGENPGGSQQKRLFYYGRAFSLRAEKGGFFLS